jgi:hypothetical protein
MGYETDKMGLNENKGFRNCASPQIQGLKDEYSKNGIMGIDRRRSYRSTIIIRH